MPDLDVLIVGAGLSGVDAAYHLQTSLPTLSFAILEAREAMGGTWDLFRYPGIRSDSDMFTLGFPFRLWQGTRGIVPGADILAYIKDTAAAYGIDRRVHYGQLVERAAWSSAHAAWTVSVRDVATGAHRDVTCRFLLLCAGFYHYDAGYTPELAGREQFREAGGRIVHPQQWTSDVAYRGKRVVVIGSGATAVTMVPALAEQAAHVTMLQRSPTYILSRPAHDPIAAWLSERVPAGVSGEAVRWKNILQSMAFYTYCRRFPDHAKRLLVRGVGTQLRDRDAVAAHFTPSYQPWDQRLCVVPDGDLFRAIDDGRVEVVTDHVDAFTARGVRLRSGRELAADLVVTATGLRLRVFGGIELVVDDARIAPSSLLVYKGMMCSDVPNMAFAIGYTNASWTLKSDLTSRYVCRLLAHMAARGHRTCTPRRVDPTVREQPIIDFSSGYVRRASGELPNQGSVSPWKLYQNYALDLALLRLARLDDPAMEWT